MALVIRVWHQWPRLQPNGGHKLVWVKQNDPPCRIETESRNIPELQRNGMERFHRPQWGKHVNLIPKGYVERYYWHGCRCVSAVTLED